VHPAAASARPQPGPAYPEWSAGESLAQEFEVSHKTSERALHAPVDEGLLVAVVGKGCYINR
jgi:DNA-binding transcriptional MocR family regulator